MKTTLFLNKLTISLLLVFPLFFIQSCTSGGGQNSTAPNANPDKKKPSAPPPTQHSGKKPNYNIYIENSGSMDGYVKGKTEFENCVYNLITDIKDRDFSDSLNLYYINSEMREWKKNADIDQISEFIERLEPTTFKDRGGNRMVSDLHSIIRMVLDKVDENNVGVIVSDFIFSPGKGKNAIEYLVSQQTNIKSTFIAKLRGQQISTLMLHCYSNFSGVYYDKENNQTQLTTSPLQRPYHIMLIGPDNAIKQFIDNINFNRLKERGYKQMCYLHKHGANPDKYNYPKVMIVNKIGKYEFEKPATKCIIYNAEAGPRKNGTSNFQFSLAVDFSGIVADSNYFTNPDKYELPPNYKISIQQVKDTTEKGTQGYTHILSLSTNELRSPSQTVFVRLKDKLPDWVFENSSDNDANIKDNDQRNKTFGLKYLFEGIEDAYKKDKNDNDYFFTTNIIVKKK